MEFCREYQPTVWYVLIEGEPFRLSRSNYTIHPYLGTHNTLECIHLTNMWHVTGGPNMQGNTLTESFNSALSPDKVWTHYHFYTYRGMCLRITMWVLSNHRNWREHYRYSEFCFWKSWFSWHFIRWSVDVTIYAECLEFRILWCTCFFSHRWIFSTKQTTNKECIRCSNTLVMY